MTQGNDQFLLGQISGKLDSVIVSVGDLKSTIANQTVESKKRHDEIEARVDALELKDSQRAAIARAGAWVAGGIAGLLGLLGGFVSQLWPRGY